VDKQIQKMKFLIDAIYLESLNKCGVDYLTIKTLLEKNEELFSKDLDIYCAKVFESYITSWEG